MEKKIDISVIIPVYNAALLIDRCLDSVFAQNGIYKTEVILIDDGSTDNSVEIIKNRREQSQIILLQQKNAGPAVARNKGLAIASGKYAAFLDADDYWLPDFFQQTISFLCEHKECIAVTVGQKHCLYGGNTMVTPSFLKDEEFNDTYFSDDIIKISEDGWLLKDFYEFWGLYNHVCTGSLVGRTNVLQKTGGQRTDMRICEDTEFWLLLATYGMIGFIPKVLFVSDGGAIVAQYGWAKYVKRFQNIPSFNVWFNRLQKRMTEFQVKIVQANLNQVVCGISRAKICGGDIKGAFENLNDYMAGSTVPVIVKIAHLGKIPFYCFAQTYRIYQYFKINRSVVLHKLHLK